MNACYKIPFENISRLNDTVAKLNRKAVKWGIQPITLATIKSIEENDRFYSWIELSGTAPRVEGFEFMGSIEFMGEIALFQAAGNGKTNKVDSKYWLNPTRNCEHCNTRRQRNKLYIVQETETGKTLQIGANCMADFARSENYAQSVVAWLTLFETISRELEENEYYSVSVEQELHGLGYYLEPAAMLIRRYGWTSKTKEKEAEQNGTYDACATITDLKEYLYPSKGDKARKQWVNRYGDLSIDDNDRETVAAALEWLKDQESNEYFNKVRQIIGYGKCNDKNAGTLISLIGTYNGAMAREAVKKERSPVIEGRITVSGKVVKTDAKDNAFGNTRYVMTVEDSRGFLIWGTVPRGAVDDIAQGDMIEFTATVEKSDRDECFGFFKRPSKFRKL